MSVLRWRDWGWGFGVGCEICEISGTGFGGVNVFGWEALRPQRRCSFQERCFLDVVKDIPVGHDARNVGKAEEYLRK